MKVWIILSLVACLLLPFRAPENGESLHLILDIPYGASVEQVRDAFRAKTGLELEGYDELDTIYREWFSFLDRQASYSARFDNDHGLDWQWVSFKGKGPYYWREFSNTDGEPGQALMEAVGEFVSIMDIVSLEYGPLSYGTLTAGDGVGMREYECPIVDGRIDPKAIAQLLVEETGRISISAFYNNIELCMSVELDRRQAGASRLYEVSCRMYFQDEPHDLKAEKARRLRSQQGLHSLWDVPFGISLDEALPILERKADIELEMSENAIWRRVCLLPKDDQKITLFGQPAKYLAVFSVGDLLLDSHQIYFEYERADSMNIDSIVDDYSSVLHEVTKAYGQANHGYIEHSELLRGKENIPVPIKEGQLDIDKLKDILSEALTSTGSLPTRAYCQIGFNNILVCIGNGYDSDASGSGLTPKINFYIEIKDWNYAIDLSFI